MPHKSQVLNGETVPYKAKVRWALARRNDHCTVGMQQHRGPILSTGGFMENTTLDNRDILLQSCFPTQMVPKFSALKALSATGHRFLTCSDGLWIEILRPWLHLTWPIAIQHKVAMPYGTLEKKVEFTMGKVPWVLLRGFLEGARAVAPIECAAWVAWDEKTGEFDFQWLDAFNQSADGVGFNRPRLPEGKHLVIDLHSHGCIEAFFSPEDDRDDGGEVKIACVMGSLDKPQITFQARICALGEYVPLKIADIDIIESLDRTI